MPELILKKMFEDYREGDQDVFKGGLLVTRLIEDNLDMLWIHKQLEDLANKIQANYNAENFLDCLRDCGFQGAINYSDKKLSSIEYVLRKKKGIPISLAMVIIGIGDLLGFRIKGINFPGHFLLRFNDLLIDPHGLKTIDVGTNVVLNNRMYYIHPKKLIETNGLKIVSRMLSNLRLLAISQNDFSKAIEYCSYQILLENINFQLYIERASLFLNYGEKENALQDIEKAILDAPSEAVRERLIVNRDKITKTTRIIH